MSHLIMLAPANYGSALAQLGKGRLSRLKSWFGGIEPGQGVLDWLELGSVESWDLNLEWILSEGSQIGTKGVFPFVLTGQCIDRSVYDALNSYTGEMGSDGVVRVAAANLRGTYIKLMQEAPKPDPAKKGKYSADALKIVTIKQAPDTALRLISGKSHSGKDMGIMRSIKEAQSDRNSQDTINSIIACIQVQTTDQYKKLCEQFLVETEAIQKNERLEVDKHFLRSDTLFFHDKCSMVIFRVRDDEDRPVSDYDLVLIAGPEADPNHLPKGFFIDRQRNRVNPETITYFFNNDVMKGTEAVTDKEGNVVREATQGAGMLGVRIVARPADGFVHYLPCEMKASKKMLESALHPNSTTLIDIRLRRVVRKNVFRLDKMTAQTKPMNFDKTKPGDEIIG